MSRPFPRSKNGHPRIADLSGCNHDPAAVRIEHMGHLRCTLKEAETEAIRLATALVATTPYAGSHRFFHAHPDKSPPKVGCGKIPAAWLVVFAWHVPES